MVGFIIPDLEAIEIFLQNKGRLGGLIILLLLALSSCNQSRERQLNTWTERLCCRDHLNAAVVDSIILMDRKEIVLLLCSSNPFFQAPLELSLTRSEKGGAYKEIFVMETDSLRENNLKLTVNNIPENFTGSIPINEIEYIDGVYRLSLTSKDHCGELVFLIQNNVISKVHILCLGSCQ